MLKYTKAKIKKIYNSIHSFIDSVSEIDWVGKDKTNLAFKAATEMPNFIHASEIMRVPQWKIE